MEVLLGVYFEDHFLEVFGFGNIQLKAFANLHLFPGEKDFVALSF